MEKGQFILKLIMKIIFEKLVFKKQENIKTYQPYWVCRKTKMTIRWSNKIHQQLSETTQ